AQNIRVLKPLGYGLDEKAQEAVKMWLFRPGTKDGKPIPIEAQIETNFRLENSTIGGSVTRKPSVPPQATSSKTGGSGRSATTDIPRSTADPVQQKANDAQHPSELTRTANESASVEGIPTSARLLPDVSTLVVRPALIYKVEPSYSQVALDAHAQGSVLLR